MINRFRLAVLAFYDVALVAWAAIILAATSASSAAGKQKPKGKRGFARQEVEAVLRAGGKLPLPAVLPCRVRYCTGGVVLGSSISRLLWVAGASLL